MYLQFLWKEVILEHLPMSAPSAQNLSMSCERILIKIMNETQVISLYFEIQLVIT